MFPELGEFLTRVAVAFVPLFVAVDVVGLLPLYLGMTAHFDAGGRRRVCVRAIFAALIVGTAFVLVGKGVFRLLGITTSDFKVAGGLVLVTLAIVDLLVPGKPQRTTTREITEAAVVPLGVPLIVGPAVLTTAMILVDEYGVLPTLVAFFLNLGLVWVAFTYADFVQRLLGTAGTRAVSKVVSLLLAAIGVMMVRVGLEGLLRSASG